MSERTTVKSNTQQRYIANEYRNSLDRSQRRSVRRTFLNDIVHCQHGLDPDCPCVQKIAVDKDNLLTEQQAKVGVASFRRSEIEKSKTKDPRYVPLTKLLKCGKDELDSHIREYESNHGPLLSKDVVERDYSISHLKSRNSMLQQNRHNQGLYHVHQ
jgi:hypothetical protein